MPKNIMYKRFVNLCAVLAIIATPLISTIKARAMSNENIISITNSVRTSNGLASYSHNGALSSAAQAKAQHMCTYDYWAHTAPDGTTGWNFMKNAGYAYVSAGENLAKGYSSDQAVVNGWMASSGHRANILSGTFRETGVGNVSCNGSIIVVAMYGVRTQSAPAPAPKPVAKPVPAPKPVPEPVAAPSIQPDESAEPKIALVELTPELTQVKECIPAFLLLLEFIGSQEISNNEFHEILSYFNVSSKGKNYLSNCGF